MGWKYHHFMPPSAHVGATHAHDAETPSTQYQLTNSKAVGECSTVPTWIQIFRDYIPSGILYGFKIGFNHRQQLPSSCRNMLSALNNLVIVERSVGRATPTPLAPQSPNKSIRGNPQIKPTRENGGWLFIFSPSRP